MQRCTVVIPCYNEETRLDAQAFLSFVRAVPGVRFLFVNDGSTDGTLSHLERLCQKAPERFGVWDLAHNVGKAEAVRQGVIRVLRGDAEFFGYWDADLATPLCVIPQFLRTLEENPHFEMILGSRVRLLGRPIRRRPLRHYLGRLFAAAASIVLRLPVYDTQCGAKLFRATPRIGRLFESPFHTNWTFDVELLARFLQADSAAERESAVQALYEFPLPEWRDIAGSKVRPADFLKAALELLEIHRTYRRGLARLGRKGTGTFFGVGVATQRDDQSGRKMSQSPAACERSQDTSSPRRVIMDRDLPEVLDPCAQHLFRAVGDAVPLADAQGSVDSQRYVEHQVQADAVHVDLLDVVDAGKVLQELADSPNHALIR